MVGMIVSIIISTTLTALIGLQKEPVAPVTPIVVPVAPSSAPVLPASPPAPLTMTVTPPPPALSGSVFIEGVPFTSQAPFGEWDDIRQEYACEEATLIMATLWLNKETAITPADAKAEILKITAFELENYNHFHDLSMTDTLKLLKDYFKYENAFLRYGIDVDDIKDELAAGNLVILPVNGQALGNPHYTPPGPTRHQILAIGYDDNAGELVVHDPGTLHGKEYRYSYDQINAGLRDYETGHDEPFLDHRTAMLVIRPRE